MAAVRKIGTITLGAPGTGSITWQRQGTSEACHVQVSNAGIGGNTFTSTLEGSLQVNVTNPVVLSSTLTNDCLHSNILHLPYMKCSVTATVIGSGTFDVWVLE